jgi:phosphoribosylformylglycinamidine synthase subunit PurS
VKAKIHVTLKQGILDPQGKAIEHALDSLGFKNAGNVRVGKYMEVDVNETDKAKADVAVKAMCEKLLANTIVEEYRYELQWDGETAGLGFVLAQGAAWEG